MCQRKLLDPPPLSATADTLPLESLFEEEEEEVDPAIDGTTVTPHPVGYCFATNNVEAEIEVDPREGRMRSFGRWIATIAWSILMVVPTPDPPADSCKVISDNRISKLTGPDTEVIVGDPQLRRSQPIPEFPTVSSIINDLPPHGYRILFEKGVGFPIRKADWLNVSSIVDEEGKHCSARMMDITANRSAGASIAYGIHDGLNPSIQGSEDALC